ncbi:hypothetical protein JCM15457_1502 [Liquorilactobacillus sucicola DSM 21376 = JCM 15457]|uniref:DUF72 domain-containing protein n=1 Tax=Liquorilactobacillus sucicola DSM 21376 = JCM 15457 TaxID=1423806 RepID=A0A023CXG1_9LACO|nr:DUF72 domain-containing protein [Liquorilactobacillus sucicola]KRN07074.1 hypothetical protein FD15_GL000643 [Liquorilactobacillus sucicola DSM 21376 = JCM 15457]GAJ26567.1 hypothetical protein JCM15457_1502 [Liquorilactobacillus sucicola DSM 21376 = JCM 15457]
MITLGLTTWSEHHALINNQDRPVRLDEYAAHFPTVELDTFFYGIPQLTTIQKWQQQVPSAFQFIVKSNRALTGHPGEQLDTTQLREKFQQFSIAVKPLVATKQLKTILCQFPPFFNATQKNVNYLKYFRAQLSTLPLTLEFRNKSWYSPQVVDSLIAFCRQEHFTLAAIDEPSQTVASVPFYPVVTTPELLLLRLHGRNQQGWLNSDKDWRKKRTLYNYNTEELTFFKQKIEDLQKSVKEVCVIFNNNSGGDAAPNALELKKLLGINFKGLGPLPPEQLDLF